MSTGFYLAAIIGAIISFLVGCLWYSVLFGKAWQTGMGFTDEKVKSIFTGKKIFLTFLCEWMSSFCTIGIFLNLNVPMIAKIIMLSVVIIFSGIKLSIFDGKNTKIILINEGYRFITILILASTFLIFI